MSLEIRSFEGDANELARFVSTHWSAQYRGAAITPAWSGRYFQWQLPQLAGGDRPLLLAAYDGARLVGALPMEDTPIRLFGESLPASSGSWFAVDPDYQRAGVGRSMLDELIRRLREREAVCMVGFVNSRFYPGKGRKFWHSEFPRYTEFSRPGVWIRVLDAGETARAATTLLDRVGARLAPLGTPWWQPKADAPGLRTYRSDDIATCLRHFQSRMQDFDIAYDWSAPRLQHHLLFGSPAAALVLEREAEVVGFTSFHVIDAVGRAACRMGIVDVIAPGTLSAVDAGNLLRGAVARMDGDGAHFAIILGPPFHAAKTLLANGFYPHTPTHRLHAFAIEPETRVLEARSAFAHYR